MSSIFRQKIDQRAEEIVNIHPGSISGIAVSTHEVTKKELSTNAWYRAINNISDNHGNKVLESEAVKNGLSFVTKSPGVTKGEKTFINPKTMQQYFGSTWGKTGDIDVTSDSLITGDMVFSGNNTQLPTVFGMTVKKPVKTMANAAPSEKAEQTPADDVVILPTPSAEELRTYNKQRREQYSDMVNRAKDVTKAQASILPEPIDPDTGKNIRQRADRTETTAMGTNARTGNVLINNTAVAMLSRGDVGGLVF
jgi:hypothetical protein